MPHKNMNLKSFKQVLSPIDKSHQNTATTIGLLACSGLNPTQQMPEMCHLLRKFFNLTSCGFFWSDQAGNMQDAWCLSPDFLSFKTLMNCLEYQASGKRTWPTYQENVLMGAVAGYLLPFQNERFYASPHFRDTYQSINVKYILDVVLHDGTRPFGALLLMRSAQQGPFTPDQRNLLVQLIPLLTKAFRHQHQSDAEYSEKEMSGFALVDQDGKYKAMSEEARRILWTLTHTQPGFFADPNDPSIELHLEQLVATHRAQIGLGEKFSVNIENRWGRFTLVFEQESSTSETIVVLHRKVPMAAQLAFSLAKFDLPPVRQIVAWLLAQNQSRKEIAAALEISTETVASHVQRIYQTTGATSSHGLMLKLAG